MKKKILSFSSQKVQRSSIILFLFGILLAACAETPDGPTALVLPGPKKNYDTFKQEHALCKLEAENAVEGQAESENHRALLGGLIGTGLGTGLGAAIGGGTGAAIGAAGGALGGGGITKGYSESKQGNIQTQYDNAYVQCMIAHNNVLPANRIIATPSSDEKSYYAH
ncbi:glycine zipper family protein [Entomobacter blattae]|uniref:Glycine-zipper-containing OmpA-like membrane domain-containing protein n=1 Tax=Entomobacter blattae TaxID=2762277 RepID=A0A7H1NT79_9PROT|nr:glycine zipper family protein [Entomobacter blattae]QNT78989.1 hypothetical protein JGUZn3_17720 [Entomobacter blattae]